LTLGERRKDRIEMFDNLCISANHQAVPAFDPHYAATGPDIDIVNPARFQLTATSQVV
jgi:hypothetical protein